MTSAELRDLLRAPGVRVSASNGAIRIVPPTPRPRPPKAAPSTRRCPAKSPRRPRMSRAAIAGWLLLACFVLQTLSR